MVVAFVRSHPTYTVEDIQVTHTRTLLNGLMDVQLRICTVIRFIFAVKIFSYAENVGYENYFA